MELRTNIRKLRNFHNMSQEDLANAIDSKRSNIGAYEEGRAEPSVITVQKIAKYFNVSMDDLVNKEITVERELKFN